MRISNFRRVTAVTGLALASALAFGGTAQAATAGAADTATTAKAHKCHIIIKGEKADREKGRTKNGKGRHCKPGHGLNKIKAKGEVTSVAFKEIRGHEVTVFQLGDRDLKFIAGPRADASDIAKGDKVTVTGVKVPQRDTVRVRSVEQV